MQKYLIVPATTNSEWDSVEFATLLITTEWLTRLANILKDIQPLYERYGINSVVSFDWDVKFWASAGDDQYFDTIAHSLEMGEMTFVDEEKKDVWKTLENKLDVHQISISTEGTFFYIAFGKHTGEEFIMNDVLISKLIEEFNNLEGK